MDRIQRAWANVGPARVSALLLALLLLFHLAIAAYNLGNFYPVGSDDVLIMSASYKLATQGVLGSDLMQTFNADRSFFFNLPVQNLVYVWILLFFALVIHGLATGRAWSAGLGVALALLWKVAGWPLWLVLIAGRRWRVLLWAGGLAGLTVVASLPWIGWMTWWRYVTEVVPGWTFGPKTTVPSYQTLTGLLQRLTRFDPTWNPAPLVNLPVLGAVVWAGAAAGAVWTMMRLARDEQRLVTAAGAAVVATVFLSPLAEQYHYLSAVVSLVVAARLHR